MIIDTHAHLTDEKYTNRDEMIASLSDNNISKVFCRSPIIPISRVISITKQSRMNPRSMTECMFCGTEK